MSRTAILLLFAGTLLSAAADPPAVAAITDGGMVTNTNLATPPSETPVVAMPLTNGLSQVLETRQEATIEPNAPYPAQAQTPSVLPVVVVVTNPPPVIDTQALVIATRESIAPSVDALASRLGALEELLSTQTTAAMESTRSANRMTLLVISGGAAAVLAGLLIAAWILARTVRQVSERLAANLPTVPRFNLDLPAPESGGTAIQLAPAGAAEQVSERFFSAIERLEKRVVELEGTVPNAHPELPASGPQPGHSEGNTGPLEFSVRALNQKQYGPVSAPDSVASPGPATMWMGKGQSLMNLGLVEDALDCYDRAIELDTEAAAEAYIKRGMALERLGQLEAAVENYERAIAADNSLTLAYLYKGAACNRLQRYREALDCYDRAIQCEQKQAHS